MPDRLVFDNVSSSSFGTYHASLVVNQLQMTNSTMTSCAGPVVLGGAGNTLYNHSGTVGFQASKNLVFGGSGAVTWYSGGDNCLVFGRTASSGTTGFSMQTVAGSGCYGCYGSGNATADFATGTGSTSVIDAANTFVSSTPRSRAEYGGDYAHGVRGEVYHISKSTGTGNQSFTPDPTTTACSYRDTGTSGTPALTIAATGTLGLTDGQRMEVMIVNGATGNMSLSWNSQFSGPMPSSISNGKYIHLDFQWCAATSKWDLLDFSSDQTYTSGMFT